MAIAHLPRRSSAANTGPLTAGAPGICQANGPNRTRSQNRPEVLLAYSGRDKREYLATFLASRSCDVTTCKDGREALARLSSGSFDLVVTGIVMPYLDGLELVCALRHRHARPPVIAIADSTNEMDRIYLRYATLSGAVATHTLCEAEGPFLKSVDWILRGRDDAGKTVIW
jgi:CheY-like chemotaxis protein